MYLAHWNMKRKPFDMGHSLAMFVPADPPMLALSKLRYVLAERLGAASLIGPPGVGKTMVLRVLEAELKSAGWTVAYLPHPGATPHDTLALILSILAIPSTEGISALDTVLRHLLRITQEGGRPVLLVDDLHTARDPGIFETLRLLLNLEENGMPCLGLVVAGQPPLAAMLSSSSDFAGHFVFPIHLTALPEEQAKKYVLYRLKVAGCERGIFTRQAAEIIYRVTRGVPRHINRLCELALFTAYALGQTRVGPEIVEMAAKELRFDLTESGEERPERPPLPFFQAEKPVEPDILAELAQEDYPVDILAEVGAE